ERTTATTQNRRRRATSCSILFRTFSFTLKEKVHKVHPPRKVRGKEIATIAVHKKTARTRRAALI
ncbi:MAG: hypothetical protein J5832_06455, partial [Clostridia bacterium]|nr:hypothetical protein [Clostridia bacterium]